MTLIGIRRALATVSLSLGAALSAASELRAEYDYGPRMDWHGGWLFGPFMMLITLGVIVVLLVFVARWFGGQGPAGKGRAGAEEDSALEILRQRFARGEIDEEEYEKRKGTLTRPG